MGGASILVGGGQGFEKNHKIGGGGVIINIIKGELYQTVLGI